ncbi:FMN-binding protein [Clostridium sp. Cult3]|uniref:FMN-binding protein n=1 Tax=Clostridium sp. Cult3 TaxID=2079004 RepID=UPI001F00B3E1|nr:FMN-binding protein [Clostridium sp. Cult3]MCF6461152.1 NADH:quinone oxidoreductase [Clostridium sp. Cult3]
MKKSFSFPIIFMVIITAFFTFILAFLNYKTTDVIAYNQETDLRRTILYVFDIDSPSDDPKVIEDIFNQYIQEEEFEGQTIYVVREGGEITGYAFPIGGTGLWGTVDGYAAISSDYNKLLGLDFVSHSETPGLGGRISEEPFKQQFRGLDLTDAKDGEYVVYRPAPDGNIDAIAGATLTSKSVSRFLNEDIDNFIKLKKGER